MRNIFKSFRQDTIIFIDGANLYYCEKTLKIKIDYQKLYEYFSQYKRLQEIRIYLAFDHQSEKDITFIDSLKEIGYTVITKKLKIIQTNSGTIVKKGNVDIELALEAYKKKDSFRTFVLFSGDSDFQVLLKEFKKLSKRLVVVSTKGHISRELIDVSHRYLDLHSLKNIIQKNP